MKYAEVQPVGIGSIKIENGRIFDGEKFFHGDIYIENNRIVSIGKNLDAKANYTFCANGNLVTPGLVDIHTHMKGVSSDAFGISPDAVCFPCGVTSAVDASAYKGTRATLDAFSVRNKVFIVPETRDDTMDFTRCDKSLQVYGDKVVGIKMYFDASDKQVKTIKPLCETVAYAEKHGLKVMVHCAGSPTPMAEVLDTLRSGDILTHAFHGVKNTALDDNFESMVKAQKRGVIIDSGFAGCVHTNFDVFEKAVQHGVIPDTLSTDITCCSAFIRGGKYGMCACMTIAEKSGMTEEQILKCVSANAAKAIGANGEWGVLKVGGKADIAVFDKNGDGIDMTDKDGNRFISESSYRCLLTVCDGNVVYRY